MYPIHSRMSAGTSTSTAQDIIDCNSVIGDFHNHMNITLHCMYSVNFLRATNFINSTVSLQNVKIISSKINGRPKLCL